MRYFVFTFLVVLSIQTAGQSIKLKINGVTAMTGEEVLAFQLSDTIPVTTNFGSGSSAAATRFEPAKIKKRLGTSTNELFKRSVTGQFLPEVAFEFYDAAEALYYKIVLKEVAIIHFAYLSPECINCNSLFHQVWFSYTKIEWTDIATGNTTRYDLKQVKTY